MNKLCEEKGSGDFISRAFVKIKRHRTAQVFTSLYYNFILFIYRAKFADASP